MIQRPRFRNTDGILLATEPFHVLSETCRLHALCESCRRVFSRSKIVRGSSFWISPTTETFTLHASILGLNQSVGQRCHFCTLVWGSLEDKEGSLKRIVAMQKSTQNPQQSPPKAEVTSVSPLLPVQIKITSSSSSTGEFAIELVFDAMLQGRHQPYRWGPRGMGSKIEKC